MDGIWGAMVWLGGFVVFMVVMMLVLKVIDMVQQLRFKLEDAKGMINKKLGALRSSIFVMEKLPYFFMIVPIIFLIINIFNNVDDITDFTISEMAYKQLIVEQAPMMAGFIFAWTILYILFLYLYDKGIRRSV